MSIYCDNCNQQELLPGTFTRLADNTYACPKCHTRYVVTCTDCNELIWRTDAHTTDYGPVCAGCIKDYTACEDCGAIVPREDLTDVSDQDNHEHLVCSTCLDNYLICDECGYYVHCDDDHGADGIVLCRVCFDEYYTTCINCGALVYVDSPDLAWTDAGPYCPTCAEDYNTAGNLPDANYSPPWRYYTTDLDTGKHPLYLGVELEVAFGHPYEATIELPDNLPEEFFAKQEACVSADGFELVSHPATLHYHLTSMNWQALLNDLLTYDAYVDGRCGLHIHLSRDYLTPTERIKLGIFTYAQIDRLSYLAGRKPNTYCYVTDLNGVVVLASTKGAPVDKRLLPENRDRYRAVNYSPSTTIELRSFAATLDLTKLLARLEWADAIANFVKAFGTGIVCNRRKGWELFISFITSQPELYSHLITILEPIFDKEVAECA